MPINIAIAGGPCTGKSTLAAALFAELKEHGADYDLITEERRHISRELGPCRSPFDRFYLWRQQEREELRSMAADGFITDSPLFQFYVEARQHVSEPRDKLAIRELFRMCLELEERYQLIVMASDPFEIVYKIDKCRSGEEKRARERHALLRSFVEHMWPTKLLFVHGSVKERLAIVLPHLAVLRGLSEQPRSPS